VSGPAVILSKVCWIRSPKNRSKRPTWCDQHPAAVGAQPQIDPLTASGAAVKAVGPR
jgi:hypothetical protein